MREILPPAIMPPNQSAGYLGFYCATYLPKVFDLVDVDGTNPVHWQYYKSSTKLFRFIEEKPLRQQLHRSQGRTLKVMAALIASGIKDGIVNSESGVYVIYEAHQLEAAQFPIELERIYADRDSRYQSMNRGQFDQWLLQESEIRV